jgi:phenylpyruvate tautomerase PptA (4-oxalocrotonate tautomerase family)
MSVTEIIKQSTDTPDGWTPEAIEEVESEEWKSDPEDWAEIYRDDEGVL